MQSAAFEYIGLLPKDDRTPQVLISEISSFWRKEVTVPERLFCIFCLNPVTWSMHTINGLWNLHGGGGCNPGWLVHVGLIKGKRPGLIKDKKEPLALPFEAHRPTLKRQLHTK